MIPGHNLFAARMDQHGQEYVESAGTGVMVSNLPLLFTRGFPSSLQHMKLDELEDFVPFMVRCSLGEENPVPWSQLPRPTWWPRKLPFRIPSASTPTAKRTALIGLVERCYSFHGCEYLLQFCTSLVENLPTTGYRFNDNRDGTTSMYHGTTGKLIVTFRNENRDYDKSNHDTNFRKKMLLSPTRVSSSGSTTAVFQPATTDIYLCDKCENEFYSLREVQVHEKHCCGDAPPSPVLPSPDPEPVEDEPEPAGQVPFLAYFKLQPAKHTGLEPYMSPRKRSSSPPRKLIGPTFSRFDSIPLTSPLGKFLLANSKLRNKYQATQHLVIRYERHLHATPHTDILSSRDRCNSRWIVVWRPNKEEQPWCHLYCFTKAQKRERRLTIQTGLNRRSRRLLSRCCPLSVSLKRLQKRVVDRVLRLNGPAVPCIDLTDEPQRVGAGEMPYAGSIFQGSVPLEMTLNGTQDPLKLFFIPHVDPQYFGTSSSSQIATAAVAPLTAGGRIPNTYTPLSTWNDEFQSAEEDPLAINPGDIITHDSVSLLPLPPVSAGQRQLSVNDSSVNHVSQPHLYSHRKNSHVLPPGPRCSKILKQMLSHKTPVVRQHKDPHTLSNAELIQLSRGDHSILNKQSSEIGEVSVRNGGSSSGLSILPARPVHIWSPSRENVSRSSVTNSVPQELCETKTLVLPQNTTGVLPSKSASIEVIDLSSDDDEANRIRISSEADHAPSQLDGLASYPHSGAKVPATSSKYSMPKNGNSHWSSNHKSHCDAGHVGDLATNGQPLNVLKIPASSNLNPEAATASAHPPTAWKEKLPLKRQCKEPLFETNNRKLLVLDISSKGLKAFAPWESPSEYQVGASKKSSKDDQYFELLEVPVSATLRSEDDSPSVYFGKAAAHVGSSQSGAFLKDNNTDLDFKMTKCKKNVSVPQINVSSKSLDSVSTESHVEQNLKHLVEKESVSQGLFSNIVSTVSKGVEFICSLVSSTGSSDVTSVFSEKDAIDSVATCDSESVKKISESNDDCSEDKSSSMSRPLEVRMLLQDECRELHRKGLGDLRYMNLENRKITRKSVERGLSRKIHKKVRKQMHLETGAVDEDDTQDMKDKGDKQCVSDVSSTPSASGGAVLTCTDENGNSPLFIKHRSSGSRDDYNRAKQSLYFSQMECSNKNNTNCDNKYTEHHVIGRKSKTFMDHYRGSSHDVPLNQNRLKDDDFINSVNNAYSNLTHVLNLSREDCEWNDTLVSEKCRNKKGGNSSQILNWHDDQSSGLLSKVTNGVDPENTRESDCSSMSEKRLDPCSQISSSYESKGSAVEGSHSTTAELGKTAEECGALHAVTPVSDSESDPSFRVLHKSSREPVLCHTLNSDGMKTNEEKWISKFKRKNSSDFRKTGSVTTRDINLDEDLKELQQVNVCTCKNLDKATNQVKVGEITLTDVIDDANLNISKEKSIDNRCIECKGVLVSSVSKKNDCEDDETVIKCRSSLVSKKEGNYSVLQNLDDSGKESLGSVTGLVKGKRTQRSLLRELNNLGKDEWKELKESGFHPMDLLRRDLDPKLDSSRDLEKEIEADISNRNLPKISEDSEGDLRTPSSKLRLAIKEKSTSLHNVSIDEYKEAHGSGCHPSEMISTEDVNSLTHSTDKLDSESLSDSVDANLTEVSDVKDISISNNTHHDIEERRRHKKALIKEMLNLDEFKVANKVDFHPSNLISTERSLHVSDKDGDDVKENQSTPVYLKPGLLLSSKRPGRPRANKYLSPPGMRKHNGDDLLHKSSSPLKPSMYLSPPGMQKQNGSDSFVLNASLKELKPTLKKHKKNYVPRELANLGKDEWKEMRNTGFHPSDLVGPKVTDFTGESEDEEDTDSMSDTSQPLKQSLKSMQQNLKRKGKLPRELARLLKDECKELKKRKRGRGGGLSRRDKRMRIQRGENGQSDHFGKSVINTHNALNNGRFSKEDKNGYRFARNTRSQANVVSLVEIFTPRDSHRQLLQTETAMCVLNFNLPVIS